MITLPTTVTSTSSTTPGTSNVSGGGAADSRAEDVSPPGSEDQPQGFLTQLGNRLLSLAQQRATNVQTTDGNSAEKEDGQSEEQPAPLAALSQTDIQAVQALYAMLPHSVQPAVSAKANGDLPDGAANKSDKPSALDALSRASARAGSDKEQPGDALAAKGSDNAWSAKAGKTVTREANDNASGSATAFQQMMGSSKDKDEPESGSALNATVTHNVLTSAAAVLTPTSTSAVSAPSTPLLNAQLGSPEWQQALGHQILMFSRNGLQTAELRLHPQDLGSIQISLKLDNDQAQLSLVSNHSQVRDALEAAIPQLRASMAESGINLGQSNVSSDAFQQNRSFHDQQQQQQHNHQETPFSLGNESDGDATPIAVPASLQARAAGNNAVDIFA